MKKFKRFISEFIIFIIAFLTSLGVGIVTNSNTDAIIITTVGLALTIIACGIIFGILYDIDK
jgi:hypothetical protein